MDNHDKSSRSIFVGNIPYDTSEEKLAELFSQAGPVISFRLVYDRETGKSKGYGFCEYGSVDVAASATRNLKDIDINGRVLRIGSAIGEQNAVEVAINNNIDIMKHPTETPYGDRVDPHLVGISINQAISSIPPEQLYDLMTEMKQFIRCNPEEAKRLLLENPQLTYTLMRAQILMNIIEPTVAVGMMSSTNDQMPLQPTFNNNPGQQMFHGQQMFVNNNQSQLTNSEILQPTFNEYQNGINLNNNQCPPIFVNNNQSQQPHFGNLRPIFNEFQNGLIPNNNNGPRMYLNNNNQFQHSHSDLHANHNQHQSINDIKRELSSNNIQW